jgi:septum formation protein
MTDDATRLILASASPRRRQLLTEAGFAFDIVAPLVDENLSDHFTLREVTCWNALRKGLAVARAHPEQVVLAADTLVGLGHQIIGKPADRAAAVRVLRRLSGRTHIVVSAVFIAHLRRGKSESFADTSRVVFKRLSDRMIADYLAVIDPLDKAGAYAAQGFGSEIIEKIDGSFTNVVGLPMERTVPILAEFGIQPKAEND